MRTVVAVGGALTLMASVTGCARAQHPSVPLGTSKRNAVAAVLRSRLDVRLDSAVVARCSLESTLGGREAISALPADLLERVRDDPARQGRLCEPATVLPDVPRVLFLMSVDTSSVTDPLAVRMELASRATVRVYVRGPLTSDLEEYVLYPSRVRGGGWNWEVWEFRRVSRAMH